MKNNRMKTFLQLLLIPLMVIAFILIYIFIIEPSFISKYDKDLKKHFIQYFGSLDSTQDIFSIAKRNNIDAPEYTKLISIYDKSEKVYSVLEKRFLSFSKMDTMDMRILYILKELNSKFNYPFANEAYFFIDHTEGIQLVTPDSSLIWNDFSKGEERKVYKIFDNETKEKDTAFVSYPWGFSDFFSKANKRALIKKIPIVISNFNECQIWIGFARNTDELKIFSLAIIVIVFIVFIIFLYIFLFSKIYMLRKTKQKLILEQEKLEENIDKLSKLSVVAQETNNCVFILDLKGDIRWANENDGFKKLYGSPNLDELIKKRGRGGRNLSDISFLNNKAKINNIIEETINSKEGHKAYFSKIENSIGKTREIRTDIYYSSHLEILYTIDTDITDKKHYERVAKFAGHCRDIVTDVSNLRSYQNIVKEILILVQDFISGDIQVFRISHPGEINNNKLLIGHVYEPFKNDNSPTYHISKEELDTPNRLGVICYTEEAHKLIITKDYQKDFEKYIKNYPVPEPLNKATYKSHVWYRVERDGEKYGYFSMQSSEPNTFSHDEHNDYIEVLGGYIAIAIKYMQTQNQENTRFDELTLDLSETINKAIFKEKQSEIEILKFFFEEVKMELEGFYKNQEHFKKPDCFVLLKYNKEKKILEGCISEPSNEKDKVDNKNIFKELDNEIYFYDCLNINESELPAIKCFKTKKSILINDYKTDRKYYFLKDKTIRGGEYEAFIYVPISNAKGDVFGVMSIQNYFKYTLTEYDLTLFKIIANYVSLVLQSLQSQEELLRIKDSIRGYSLIDFEHTPNEVKQAINRLNKSWNELFGDGVISYSYANRFGREIIKIGEKHNFTPLIKYGEWLKKRSAENHNFKELKDDIKFFNRIK